MSITNRPLPIRKILVGDSFPSGFDGYDYFNRVTVTGSAIPRTFHGMPKFNATEQQVWEPVISYVGHPGMCYFLAYAIKNSSGSAKEFGVRLSIDGAFVYGFDRVTVANSAQHGNSLIGNMFFQSTGELQAISSWWSPYNSALQLHVYRETSSSFDFCAVAKNYWTT